MLKSKSSENFVPNKISQILAVLVVFGSKVLKSGDFTAKARPCVNPRHLSHILGQNRFDRDAMDCDQSDYSSSIIFSYIPSLFGPTGSSAIRYADIKNPTQNSRVDGQG